jgi:purine-binding chemotaxis protein CheW
MNSAATPDVAAIQRILQERARILARSATEESAVKTVPLVELAIGPEHVGVGLQQVQEIQPLRGLTPVPGAPAHWAGVVNLRGRLFPVLDLRQQFGLAAPARPDSGLVVVIAAAGLEAALWASDVLGVRHVRPEDIQPAPADARPQRFVSGVTAELMSVLDLEKLLSGVNDP